MRKATIALLALVIGLPLAEAKKAPVAVKKLPPSAQGAVQAKEVSLVRVNVTGQPYDYFRPWQKKAPFSKRALGAVLSQGQVLVTADLVSNQNYVELERAESGEKTAATVVVVDYEANLALLEPIDKNFLKGLQPLDLALDTVVGDKLAAWQLEPTGALVVTEGIVTTIGMSRYPADVADFLTYRLSIPMQYRDNSYTVPLVKNNKLAALLLRFDPRTQVMDAIPAPIIAHFLRDAKDKNYDGFPSLGISFFPTRDPQLREYAGEDGGAGGVYITAVEPGQPAAKAGLQPGDIVLAADGKEIDKNGNYVDTLYGKLGFGNLINGKGYVGDRVPLKVLRHGKPLTLNVKLEHRAEEDYVIPPYNIDDPPNYYVLGGLVFQELTRQYLKEWGANWQKDAPQDFVYLDKFQSELFPEGKRHVVILSQVLPANSTLGYDDYSYLVVKRVNGKEIKSLADLVEAAKTPINNFHVIETADDPKQLELDAAEVERDAQSLQENYGLPALQRLQH